MQTLLTRLCSVPNTMRDGSLVALAPSHCSAPSLLWLMQHTKGLMQDTGARWEHNSANSNSTNSTTTSSNCSGHHQLLVPLPQQTASLGVLPDALPAAHHSLTPSHPPCQQKLPLQPQQQAWPYQPHSHKQGLRCAQHSQLSTLAASTLLQLGRSFQQQQQQHPLQLRRSKLVLWQQQWQAANGVDIRMAYHKQQGDTSSTKTHQSPSHSSQLPSLQEQQPGHTAPPGSLHDHTKHPELQGAAAAAAAAATGAAGGDRVPGSAFTSLPNLLSLSRVAMGPWLAYCIATQQWPTAVAITAAAGATDWLDGYLARTLGHTSKLGSYLDPLADKVFVATAVGTMGCLGMLPAWLAVLVVGRDSSQVVGMFWYRLRMFGGSWPGAAAFFDVDHAVSTQQQQHQDQHQKHQQQQEPLQQCQTDEPSASSSSEGAVPPTGQQLPMMRPLLVSKANTALVMALVAGCMAHQWQGVPGQEVLQALELGAAGTTMASAVAYARLYLAGQLLAAGATRAKGQKPA